MSNGVEEIRLKQEALLSLLRFTNATLYCHSPIEKLSASFAKSAKTGLLTNMLGNSPASAVSLTAADCHISRFQRRRPENQKKYAIQSLEATDGARWHTYEL
jgi:hypothetical protein